MDEDIPTETSEEEKVNIQDFVDEFIRRDYSQKVTQSFEYFEDETEMWLEVNDQECGEASYDHYYCSECSSHIGNEDSDVFEHVRNAHPSVVGMKDKEPNEDNEEFEDA